jgi:hypothetical protein
MATGNISAREAYRELYRGCNSWETAGPRLSKNVQLAQRIEELKAEQAAESKLSRDDLRRWSERVIMATPNQASLDSDICELVMTKNGPVATTVSKIGGMERLIRLCGLDKGTEAENKTSDSIADLIIRIRSGGGLSTDAGSAASQALHKAGSADSTGL